jgi:hypothetical protein
VLAGDRKAFDQALRVAVAKSVALKTAMPKDSSNRVVVLQNPPGSRKNTFTFHDGKCTVTLEVDGKILKEQLTLSFAEGEDGIDKLREFFNWKEVRRDDPEDPKIDSRS